MREYLGRSGNHLLSISIDMFRLEEDDDSDSHYDDEPDDEGRLSKVNEEPSCTLGEA
jgi:hypothetical protein